MNSYKVVDSREMSTMTQTGTERKFYRVWIQTDRGASGHLDVVHADWNEAKLPGLLQAKADDLDLAFRLSG